MHLEMPIKFDYTMMSTFMVCHKKYYWRIVRGIVPVAPPTAAEFGRCIHSALDVWFKTHDRDKTVETFLNTFDSNLSDHKRTPETGKKLLELYCDKYAHEGFKVLKSEVPFDVVLPNTDVTLIGRIDKIVEWDGAIYIMDHKTTSRLGFEYFYRIKPNMQFDGYIYAAQQIGYPKCSGVILDALLVAKGLLVSAQLAKLTPLARDVSTRTEQDIARYLENTVSIISDIKRCYDGAPWYENTESCCNFIECPYRRICKEDPEIHEQIIKSDYKIEQWDPTKEAKDGALRSQEE